MTQLLSLKTLSKIKSVRKGKDKMSRVTRVLAMEITTTKQGCKSNGCRNDQDSRKLKASRNKKRPLKPSNSRTKTKARN